MIIVTGATGQLGGAIVERLLERIPADQIGVSVRDPRQGAGTRGARRAGAARRLRRPGDPGATRSRAPIAGAARLATARRDAGTAPRPRSRPPGRPAPGGSSTPATWARTGTPRSRRDAGPRRNRGGPAGIRGRVHLAAQRLLRAPAAIATRAPGAADRRARRRRRTARSPGRHTPTWPRRPRSR